MKEWLPLLETTIWFRCGKFQTRCSRMIYWTIRCWNNKQSIRAISEPSLLCMLCWSTQCQDSTHFLVRPSSRFASCTPIPSEILHLSAQMDDYHLISINYITFSKLDIWFDPSLKTVVWQNQEVLVIEYHDSEVQSISSSHNSDMSCESTFAHPTSRPEASEPRM